MATKKKLNEATITKAYIDYVLTENEKPKSVFAFAKTNGFKENEFHQFYGSFEAIENSIFKHLFDNALELLEKDEAYQSYNAQNKLLSFYFTYFELLTANRSFILFILKGEKHKLKALKKLSALKEAYKTYVDLLGIKTADLKFEKAEEFIQNSVTEMSWGQFLFTLRYWMNDTSPSFEKTDVLIEKSIKTGFQILDTSPLEGIIDLGKFLFKDTFKK